MVNSWLNITSLHLGIVLHRLRCFAPQNVCTKYDHNTKSKRKKCTVEMMNCVHFRTVISVKCCNFLSSLPCFIGDRAEGKACKSYRCHLFQHRKLRWRELWWHEFRNHLDCSLRCYTSRHGWHIELQFIPKFEIDRFSRLWYRHWHCRLWWFGFWSDGHRSYHGLSDTWLRSSGHRPWHI